MNKKHAPRDVYETRDGYYLCGVCRQPVVRFSAPRARWQHVASFTETFAALLG